MDPKALVDLAMEDLGLSNLFRHFRDKRISIDEIVKAVDEAYSVSLVERSEEGHFEEGVWIPAG